MEQYLNLFIDNEYPIFIDKYLATSTLKRLKHITQFCGCDYTNLYSPLFKYTRFNHSLVVAHMTWHFTHDKKETIMALLHDVGTPCFAHCIDYVFGDYLNQESSEKNIIDIIKKDKNLQDFLQDDGLSLKDLNNYSNFYILENKSPKLCTDRLDGVLHTCYVWLHTHSLEQIKEVYDNIIVLENEDGKPEIGFKDINIAEKFSKMVYNYAKELQGNTDKFVMQYVSEIVKLAVKRNLISIEDLYIKKEKDICNIFKNNFSSWNKFNKASVLVKSNVLPQNNFFVSFATKRRNTIPLVQTNKGNQRINLFSKYAKEKYKYEDTKYAYIEEIENLD